MSKQWGVFPEDNGYVTVRPLDDIRDRDGLRGRPPLDESQPLVRASWVARAAAQQARADIEGGDKEAALSNAESDGVFINLHPDMHVLPDGTSGTSTIEHPTK